MLDDLPICKAKTPNDPVRHAFVSGGNRAPLAGVGGLLRSPRHDSVAFRDDHLKDIIDLRKSTGGRHHELFVAVKGRGFEASKTDRVREGQR